MISISKALLPAAALLAALAGAARADDCQRLVQPVGPTTYGKGTHQAVFSAPTTQGQWFVVVTRDGPSPGRVELNGREVVSQSDLAGPSNRYVRVPVSVRATLNVLKVVVHGQTQLTVSVVGAVPATALAPGVGRRAGRMTVFERTYRGGQLLRTTAPSTATDGLFDLRVRQGRPRVVTATLLWNGEPVLGALPILPGRDVASGPVRVRASNTLDTLVVGTSTSFVTVTLDGLVVDEVAPVVAWAAPAPGAALGAGDPIRLTFSDAVTGVASVRITLDGADVTSSFDVLAAEATSSLARLPALAAGTHELRTVVVDRACNETTRSVSFVVAAGGGDHTPPVITQPSNVTAEQASPAGALVTFPLPTATDAVDPSPSVVCVPASGTLFPPGATTVTCTATDASGNSAQATFVVLVLDRTAPVLAQPADVTAEQASPAGAVVTFATPMATDVADPTPTVVCAPASGTLFPPGATTVTCTATDHSGNSAQLTFVVRVVDRTAPSLAQQADLIAEQAAPAGTVVTFATPVATDAADAAPTVVCAPASGTLFAPGATTVTCTATDHSGNSSSVTFVVRVLDTTPPALVTPGDLTVDATDATGAVVTFSVTATDAADPAPIVSSSPASGARFPVGATTVTCTARDASGNASAATFVVTVRPFVEDTTVARLELTVGPPRRAPVDQAPLLEQLGAEPRSIDGRGHDVGHPDEGAADALFQRQLLGADYADGLSSPAGAGRASARRISNAVHAQATSIPNARGVSDLLGAWGQFLDHDLSLSGTATPHERFNLPVPPGDPLGDTYTTTYLYFSRSAYDHGSSPREQTNRVTAWLDGSMVYGSDATRAAALRANDGTGRLRTSAGDLLPMNTGTLENQPTADAFMFLAGDVRANQNTPLLALHTLFVREHNRLAGLLAARHPGATDEELYQGARRIVVAELQAITYEEFLPALLGPAALAPYAGYDAARDVGIENGFAAAGFRVGHTLISTTFRRLAADGTALPSLTLADAQFAPGRLSEEGGLDALLRGLAAQPAQELDPFVVDAIRSYLFGQPGTPGSGIDLMAFDLQRGRDHGLPGYAAARTQLGLAPRASFAEISTDPVVQARLASVYASVDQVDLITGALCEDHAPGALVGELLLTLLKRQFELLRDGDRFFYENELPPAARDAAKATRLADVIRRNTGVGAELQDHAFEAPALLPYTEHDFTVRAVTASGATATGFTGFVQVAASDGKAPLDGLVLELTPEDQGRLTSPGLAFFQTLGPITLTARTLPLAPTDPIVSGALTAQVVLEAPALYPALPASLAPGAELVLQGLAFPGQWVELVIDGQLVATEIAGAGGAFTATVRLTPGRTRSRCGRRTRPPARRSARRSRSSSRPRRPRRPSRRPRPPWPSPWASRARSRSPSASPTRPRAT